ncbi:MAG: hypothetical protein KTR26_16055 [Flammeovirgaceae bacterium]|nr:hypothetical protein [Flammeovirgaceae bacterium]
MISQFISHKWKETKRSTFWQKNLAINIILGFFIFYFLLNFLILGIFIDKALEEFFPDENPVEVFNGFILYYAMVDLFMRFQLQELPVMTIQPYLHLPIRRSKIINYLLGKSIFNLLNFFPWLIFIPFSIKVLIPQYGVTQAEIWLFTLIFLGFTNNYLIVYVKRQMTKKLSYVVIFVLGIASVTLLDYFEIISLSNISTRVFNYALISPVPLLVVMALLGFFYYLNYQFILDHTYLDEISTKKNKEVGNIAGLKYFDRFGEIGQFILLDIKLILRNKRPRTVAWMTLFFLFYGLIFYPQEIYIEGYYMLFFVGTFITGLFIFNYGQFILGWESNYFDGILTNNIDPNKYYQAKFWLLVPISFISFIFSLPYVFFGWKVVAINLAMFLFNIGVNVFVVLYFSTYNNKAIELSKGGAMNWQGVGISQFILMIPCLILPMIFFLPFDLMDIPYYGLAIIGSIGLISSFFYKFWISIIAKRFVAEKHKIASGFRQK